MSPCESLAPDVGESPPGDEDAYEDDGMRGASRVA